MNNISKIALSRLEAAAALGICRATLDKLIGSGQIRSHKLGRKTLIPAEAIQEFLAGQPSAARPAKFSPNH